ncbi:SMP-30/gluconolactonase/LRE family protein [Arthrobacter sp. MA-N2]|uniref:SMP-30/gluconolactonase/LRE family protein n=1 Tax=Arthrobacter sp. MA-N2 TaxID=1101188 RepID=UPI0009DD4D10|nr:SMP-30/gluconolactonase/LRE family protein [Arthrobacter sp. MA-N2]
MVARSAYPVLQDLIAPDAEVERIATGFTFTEGPIWMQDNSLHFSDMPQDKRRRWHEDEGLSIVRAQSNKCNGMTRDADGHLIVCEHSTSSVVREAEGERHVLASEWKGKELNSPNDVVVASDGSVFFTDPTYGRMPVFGVEREVELDFRGVYRLPPTGGLELLLDDFAQPNGLCFSPDESLLYVNDTERAHVRVFDVTSDGRLQNGRVFAAQISEDPGAGDGFVDGMKVDEQGNLYVTAPGGIWVYAPDGSKLGSINVPEKVANMNWGGPDWKTLYITASTSIYRLRMRVGGNLLGYMRRQLPST